MKHVSFTSSFRETNRRKREREMIESTNIVCTSLESLTYIIIEFNIYVNETLGYIVKILWSEVIPFIRISL